MTAAVSAEIALAQKLSGFRPHKRTLIRLSLGFDSVALGMVNKENMSRFGLCDDNFMICCVGSIPEAKKKETCTGTENNPMESGNIQV